MLTPKATPWTQNKNSRRKQKRIFFDLGFFSDGYWRQDPWKRISGIWALSLCASMFQKTNETKEETYPEKSNIRLLKRAFGTQTISLDVGDSPHSKGKDTHHGKRYPWWLEVKGNSKWNTINCRHLSLGGPVFSIRLFACVFVWDRISPCSPGCFGSCCVD